MSRAFSRAQMLMSRAFSGPMLVLRSTAVFFETLFAPLI
jgi:hypothetical protein